jgi:hypothetical protein
MPTAQKAATAVLDIRPSVQRRLGTGDDRYLPTRSPTSPPEPMATPFKSKYARVDKVTIAGESQMLRSASDSHILSHVRSYSGGESATAVAIF